jgi:hypothetical protein
MAGATIQVIVPSPAGKIIVAGKAEQRLVPSSAHQVIVPRCP